MAKYTSLTVVTTEYNYLTSAAADHINAWASSRGYSGGFSEAEIEASRRELEREISECDEYIRERLTIEEMVEELEE